MLTVMGLIRTTTPLSPAVVTEALTSPALAGAGRSTARGQVFNLITDRTQKGIAFARGDAEIDAITQFFFADVSASLVGAGDGGLPLTMGLSPARIDRLQPVLCLQNTVIAPPEGVAAVKRMSILRMRPDVSAEAFQDQWFNLHAVLVRRLPGILGYRQNLVIDGPRDSSGAMAADGLVELWFPDAESIERAFRSDIGNTTMMHAREFIADISTFLVEPTRVAGVG